MPDMCKLLDEVEKKLYIQGLAYVLGMNKQDPKQKRNTFWRRWPKRD